jgi:hypothetical protein
LVAEDFRASYSELRIASHFVGPQTFTIGRLLDRPLTSSEQAFYLIFVGAGIAAALAVGCSAALIIVNLYRRVRRADLRRRVRDLIEANQRGSVLAPLYEEGGEVRKLVAPLLGEFGLATELAPAAVPPGRGDDTSPAGRTGLRLYHPPRQPGSPLVHDLGVF